MEGKKKDYKYKLVEKEMSDVRRDFRDSGRDNMWVRVKNNPKDGIFKPVLGYRKKDFSRSRISSSEYGEFIAYKLAKQINIPVCEAEFALKRMKLRFSKSGRTVLLPGSISYVDLEKNENLVQAITIIGHYGTEHKDEYKQIVRENADKLKSKDARLSPSNDANNNNVDIIMLAFESYAKSKCHITDDQWNVLKQNMINMMFFDLKFANRDRNDENYGLAINDKTGSLRLYPIFDNEYILGFCEFQDEIEARRDNGTTDNHISNELTSRIGNSSRVTDVNYKDMIKYLFQKYPKESEIAYNKVMQIKREDLEELLEECEGLPETHKEYALQIFDERDRGFIKVKKMIDEGTVEHEL